MPDDDKQKGIFDGVEEMITKKLKKEIESLGLDFQGVVSVDIFPKDGKIYTRIGFNAKVEVTRAGTQFVSLPLAGDSEFDILTLPMKFTIPIRVSK